MRAWVLRTVVDDFASYTYSGTWEGQFYGPEATATMTRP